MNYRLLIMVFSKEMANVPIRFAVQIPESLAKSLLNTHVTAVRLAMDEGIAPATVQFIDYKNDGLKLPDRLSKSPGGKIKIDGG